MSVNGRVQYVHRLVLEATLGRKLADGEHALHRCDNPPCCDPEHLFAGTRSDNMADARAKGRTRNTYQPGDERIAGEANPKTKLTREQVREIRRLHATGDHSLLELSMTFGVTRPNVGYIVRGVTWKDA